MHFAERDPAVSPAALTFDSYAEDVERLRRAVGFEKTVVLGHSHHGCIALEYAKRFPERVSHVVMIGSPPVGVEQTLTAGAAYWAAKASEERKALLRRNWAALGSDVLAKLTPEEDFVTRYVADGPKYWYDARYDASWLWSGVPIDMELIRSFRDLFTDYHLSWDPARLRTPVLIVMGQHDYVVPPPLWDQVLPSLPNATYRLLKESGHTPQMEEPGQFNAILLRWLREA